MTLSGFPAWWAARTYHVSQMPGTARKLHAVADWTVGLPFGRDTAEVGSIGHPHPLRAEVYEKGGTHRPVCPSARLALGARVLSRPSRKSRTRGGSPT